MAKQHGKKSNKGWTLIEVLVALTLMTILSTLGYKGISTLITTESTLREETQHLLDLDTAFTQADTDWEAQWAALSPRIGKASTTPLVEKNEIAPVDASQWELTSMPGWIPSPAVLPKVPDPIASYLAQRYVVRYIASPQGGIDRFVGCVTPDHWDITNKNAPVLCQQWHMLHHFPMVIEGASSQKLSNQPRWMRWTVSTPQGKSERLWGFPAML